VPLKNGLINYRGKPTQTPGTIEAAKAFAYCQNDTAAKLVTINNTEIIIAFLMLIL